MRAQQVAMQVLSYMLQKVNSELGAYYEAFLVDNS